MANKINANKEDLIVGYISNEWNTFYSDKIQNLSNLFNRKLCYEEKSGNFLNYFYEFENKNTTPENNNEEENNENEEYKEENNENNNVNYFILFIFLFRLRIMKWKMIKRILNMN